METNVKGIYLAGVVCGGMETHKWFIEFMLDEALIKQGAIFSNAEPFESYVITDGNIVTGQNPVSATGVALEMIDLLINN